MKETSPQSFIAKKHMAGPSVHSPNQSGAFTVLQQQTAFLTQKEMNDSWKTQRIGWEKDGPLTTGFGLLGDYCIVGKHCARCSMSIISNSLKPGKVHYCCLYATENLNEVDSSCQR